jgi:phage terminase large subunit GpA-like protein
MKIPPNKIKIINPPWLPKGLKDRLKDQGAVVYVGAFSPADRKVMRKRPPVPASEWAEKHRVLTMSSLPGAWRNHVTPYLAGVMDASFFPSVQTVIICKAPQTGGSEAIHNCIGYAIDRAPGPVLYVYPDEKTAKENSKDRIRPMIKSSPRLRSYMTGASDDDANIRINLQHMPIYLAWASSAGRLANKPIRHLVFDETDKYPDTAGKRETGPISLGEKRTITYKWNRKIWKISTPTIETGHIWTAMTKEAQAVFDFWVKCPHCLEHQLMKFKNIRWPEDERNPETIESENLAWYECEHCKAKWNDEDRNKAVRGGEWRHRETERELYSFLDLFRPVKIGFHIPSWLSYFVSLSEVASAFLKGNKDKTLLKDFKNAHCAEPWVDYRVERTEDAVLKLKDERPRGQVPNDGVAGLTAAVDTQADGFYYEVRAWGYGLSQESWQIREGFVDTFEALEWVLFEDVYKDVSGKRYVIHLTVMDAMGGTRRQTAGVGTRTSEVYDFCRLHRGSIYPFKGEQRMNQPISYSRIDTYPGTNKSIPGGIQLMRGNVTYFKNKLANKLEIAPADPGAWHLHSETTDDWARQMTAEYTDENSLWQCRPGAANHAWDVSVYNLVAAEAIGIKFWPEQKRTKAAIRKEEKPKLWREKFKRPSWLSNR